MHKQPQDPAAAREALKFFDWAYAKGDKMAEDLDYVPMPDKVVGAIQKIWSTEIKDSERQAALRASRTDAGTMEKAPRRRLFLHCPRSEGGLCRGRARPLEWLPTSMPNGSSPCSPPGGEQWLISRCRASSVTADAASSRAKVLARLRLGDSAFPHLTRAAADLRAAAARRRHRLADHRRLAGAAAHSALASSSASAGTRSPKSSARSRRSTARSSPR